MQVQKGPKFEYLGMEIEYTSDGEAKIGMMTYIDDAINCIGENIGNTYNTPAGENLFKTTHSPDLHEEKRKLFHSCVAKLLYIGKRGRPDILLPVTFLASRVTKATENDWNKL